MAGDEQTIHLPAVVPKEHSSQILTKVMGLTYESQTGHLPSHFSHMRPIAIPGCLRHISRSGWCLDILEKLDGYSGYLAVYSNENVRVDNMLIMVAVADKKMRRRAS